MLQKTLTYFHPLTCIAAFKHVVQELFQSIAEQSIDKNEVPLFWFHKIQWIKNEISIYDQLVKILYQTTHLV